MTEASPRTSEWMRYSSDHLDFSEPPSSGPMLDPFFGADDEYPHAATREQLAAFCAANARYQAKQREAGNCPECAQLRRLTGMHFYLCQPCIDSGNAKLRFAMARMREELQLVADSLPERFYQGRLAI